MVRVDAHGGGRELLSYMTSLLRAQSDEHADQLLPPLQPAQLKHLAYMADALFYWLRIAYAGRSTDGWHVLSDLRGSIINESDQLHPSAHAVLNALVSEEAAAGAGSGASSAEDADPDGLSGLRRWHLFQEEGLSIERLPLDFRNRFRRYNRSALLHIGRLSLPTVAPGTVLAGSTPAPSVSVVTAANAAAAAGAASVSSSARDSSSGGARERIRALQERQSVLEQEMRELVAQGTALAARESLTRGQPYAVSASDSTELERQQHTLLESLLAVSTPPPPAINVNSESNRTGVTRTTESSLQGTTAGNPWNNGFGFMGPASAPGPVPAPPVTSDHTKEARSSEIMASSHSLASSQPLASML